MAAATLVATAFGIIIIIVTAYVLAGGTLLTSEVVINAQKDMTDLQVKMLGTSMRVVVNTTDGSYYTTDGEYLYLEIFNNGREPIRDFKHMDVYLPDSTTGCSLYSYVEANPPSIGNWTKNGVIMRVVNGEYKTEAIYRNQWDPGEILRIKVNYQGSPEYFKIVTSNGVSMMWQSSDLSP